ncbi:AraC family transcriptional regulator [Stenotrophobium rhamnosiphilum]|nr:AraC family transcriptional regulator [Stenotrophobium rhamnosiphilum]
MSFSANVLSYPDMSNLYLPARYYAMLGNRLTELGVDVPALLREAQIKPEALLAADGQLTAEQVDSMVSLAALRTQRSDLGFELGRVIKLSAHDILGYAMLSAPTLDAALRLVARYFSLITPTYLMQYRSHATHAEMNVRPALPITAQVLAFHQETIAVAYYETVKTLLAGAPASCSIYLSIDPPPHVDRYRELSAATIHFSQTGLPGARIVFDKALVDRPLVMADQNTVKMAEARCAEMLNNIVNRSSLSEWTYMMLRQAADGQPTLEELASILNLSPRTLERRLFLQGSKFRDIANKARHETACALIKSGRLNITQIAYHLGYTDAANFTRAFRREAGVSPNEFRQKQQSDSSQT